MRGRSRQSSRCRQRSTSMQKRFPWDIDDRNMSTDNIHSLSPFDQDEETVSREAFLMTIRVNIDNTEIIDSKTAKEVVEGGLSSELLGTMTEKFQTDGAAMTRLSLLTLMQSLFNFEEVVKISKLESLEDAIENLGMEIIEQLNKVVEWSDLSVWEAGFVQKILLWANCPPFLDMCFRMLLRYS